MKRIYIKYLLLCLVHTQITYTAVSTNRIKGWLELDSIKQKITNNIEKYNNLEAELKNETNAILEESIQAADELAQDDSYAALVMYRDMKQLKNKTKKSSLDIAAINKRYEQLSDYIDQTFKELVTIRRKHLQFPC